MESRGFKWSEYRRSNGRNRQQLHSTYYAVAPALLPGDLGREVRPTTQGYYTMSEQPEPDLLYQQRKDHTFLASKFGAMSVTPCQTKIYHGYTRFYRHQQKDSLGQQGLHLSAYFAPTRTIGTALATTHLSEVIQGNGPCTPSEQKAMHARDEETDTSVYAMTTIPSYPITP